MKIFFINDRMELIQLLGTIDERMDTALLGAEENKPWKGASGGGSLGVITPANTVKASIQFSLSDRGVRTKIREFITKYMVLEALQKHADLLKKG